MSATVDAILDELPALISAARLAALLDVSDRTVRRWQRSGRIRETFKTARGRSGRVLIPKTEVARLLEEMRQ